MIDVAEDDDDGVDGEGYVTNDNGWDVSTIFLWLTTKLLKLLLLLPLGVDNGGILLLLLPITDDLVVVVNFDNKIEQFVNDDDVLILLLLLFTVCLELVILIGTVVHEEALNDADRCTCSKGVEDDIEVYDENPEEYDVGRAAVDFIIWLFDKFVEEDNFKGDDEDEDSDISFC